MSNPEIAVLDKKFFARKLDDALNESGAREDALGAIAPRKVVSQICADGICGTIGANVG